MSIIVNNTTVNNTKEMKIGVILTYITIGVELIVAILYTPLLTGYLGQQQYGLYNIGQSIVGYLGLSELGFGNAIVRYTTKYRLGREDEIPSLYGFFCKIYGIIACFILCIGVIIAVFSNYLFRVSTGDKGYRELRIIIVLMVINLSLTFVMTPFSAIITAYEKWTFAKITNLLYIVLKPIAMIPLLVLGYKAIALSVVTMFFNLLLQIANVFYAFKKINIRISMKSGGIGKEIIKEIFNYSFYIFLAMIVSQINNNADKTILGIISGEIAVSVYSIGYLIRTYLEVITSSIAGVQFPRVVRLVEQSSTKKILTERMIKMGRIQFFASFLVTSGFLFFGKNFICLWVGDDYRLSYYVALAIGIPLIIPSIQTTAVQIIQALNRNKFRSILLVGCAVMNVIISVPIGRVYGPVGCAACTGITLFFTEGLVMNWYYEERIGLDMISFWKEISLLLFKISPLLLVGYFMQRIFGQLNWLFLVEGIICYAILFLVYILIFCMNEYEKELVKEVIHKVRKLK